MHHFFRPLKIWNFIFLRKVNPCWFWLFYGFIPHTTFELKWSIELPHQSVGYKNTDKMSIFSIRICVSLSPMLPYYMWRTKMFCQSSALIHEGFSSSFASFVRCTHKKIKSLIRKTWFTLLGLGRSSWKNPFVTFIKSLKSKVVISIKSFFIRTSCVWHLNYSNLKILRIPTNFERCFFS